MEIKLYVSRLQLLNFYYHQISLVELLEKASDHHEVITNAKILDKTEKIIINIPENPDTEFIKKDWGYIKIFGKGRNNGNYKICKWKFIGVF